LDFFAVENPQKYASRVWYPARKRGLRRGLENHMKSRNSAKLNRLDDMTVRSLVKAGKPGLRRATNDGGGLNLKITGVQRASWVFRYKSRCMGLGSYPLVTLAEARDKAHELRKLLDSGIDPLEHRDATRRKVELDKAKEVTFGYCAKIWFDGKRKTCTEDYVNDLERRLRKYAYPLLENLPIRDIDTPLILQVLEPIWDVIPVTADDWIRASLEEIFDLAKARTYRNFDSQNPARWVKHLEYTELPPVGKIHTVQHYKSLPYPQLPEFITLLRNWDKRGGATGATAPSLGASTL
jgi:hypothetical protein